MLDQSWPAQVWVATRPAGFLKGRAGIVAPVAPHKPRERRADANGAGDVRARPVSRGAVSVFRSKHADRIELRVRDQTGPVPVHKRLEGPGFLWPQIRDGVMRMASAQLAALIKGLDWRLVRPKRARRPLVSG